MRTTAVDETSRGSSHEGSDDSQQGDTPRPCMVLRTQSCKAMVEVERSGAPGGLRRATARRGGGRGQRGRLAGHLRAQVARPRLLPGRGAVGGAVAGAEIHAPPVGRNCHQVQPGGLRGAHRRNVHHRCALRELADIALAPTEAVRTLHYLPGFLTSQQSAGGG